LKYIISFLYIFQSLNSTFAQNIKVAILDFENTSGIAKYNGLGKAMSSMLITDIEANVSPKRLQLVERSQIQKVLKEQNFQASSAVDKTSSVKAGKLLGVKYLLVGDIYILDDVLVINARLTDTETGDIKFSKKQEGKLVGWLNLKTNIAKDLAASIAMPFTEPNIPDKEINMATITSFGNAITAKDEGKIEKAEEIVKTIQEFSPDFKYLDDLKNEIEELKKRLEKVEQDIKDIKIMVTSDLKDIDNRIIEIENKISKGIRVNNPKNLEDYLINASISYATSDFKETELMLENIFKEGYIKYDLVYMYFEVLFNIYNGDSEQINHKKDGSNLKSDNLIRQLVELDYNNSGINYYIKLDKFKIQDSVLRAFMENNKAKIFYIDVMKYPESGDLMKFWIPKMSQNEKLLGMRLIKAKSLFFNYNNAYKKYLLNTSYTNDENAIWRFYNTNSFIAKNDEERKSAENSWLKLLSKK